MTKDDISNAVHRATNHFIKTGLEADIESVLSPIMKIFASHGIVLSRDELQEIYRILCINTVDRCALATIKTLFDLGLLTQGPPD